MTERKRGVENLEALPLRDVLLQPNHAIRHLTDISKQAILSNANSLAAHPGNQEAGAQQLIKGLKLAYLSHLDKNPGGLSLTQEELRQTLETVGSNVTFKQLVSLLASQRFTKIFESAERQRVKEELQELSVSDICLITWRY